MRIFCPLLTAICAVLFVSPVVTSSEKEKEKPTITVDRETLEVHGWTVRIDKRLLPEGDLHEKIGKTALDLLKADLTRIALIVPSAQLSDLRKVTIVIDEHPELKSAQYHPSRSWLTNNGYEASLEKCVHVSRASTYVNPDHAFVQPSMMLHELAHAYHDQILGFEFEPVKKAFTRAQLEGKYKDVLFVKGGKRKHYALTNHKEYFAENTEAYFGTNDFYPFVRSELKEHDPRFFEILNDIWGKQKSK